MTKTEVKKAFTTRNKIKKEIKTLSDRLWKSKLTSEQYSATQIRLKDAEKNLIDQYPDFQKALAITLCPNAEQTTCYN